MKILDKSKLLKEERIKVFAKLKKKILKKYPTARTKMRKGEFGTIYQVETEEGKILVNPDLLLPLAISVFDAWQQAGYSLWHEGMVQKSYNAFSDERIYRQLSRSEG